MLALLLSVAGLAAVPEPIAPPWVEPDVSLADLAWFPCEETATANIAAAAHHLAWLRCERDMDPRGYWYWRERIDEAQQLRDTWTNLRDAQTSWNHDPFCAADLAEDRERRLDELRALRKALGAEAYRACRMPLAVPAWRFTEIR